MHGLSELMLVWQHDLNDRSTALFYVGGLFFFFFSVPSTVDSTNLDPGSSKGF